MGRTCVFFDRDGVINHNAPPGDYIRSWEQFRLIPQVVDWIRLLNRLDYLVIVITNQRGVALGLMTEAQLNEIHANMQTQLLNLGARIDDIFYCPHDEGSCDCRKPLPGMIQKAVQKWDINLTRSALIGDSKRDEGLALACGLRFIPVAEGRLCDRLGEVRNRDRS